jgi:hypothetical protein
MNLVASTRILVLLTTKSCMQDAISQQLLCDQWVFGKFLVHQGNTITCSCFRISHGPSFNQHVEIGRKLHQFFSLSPTTS